MAFPGSGAAGSGAANTYGVISTNWSPTINKLFINKSFYEEACNTDYSKDLTFGDSVVISNEVLPSDFAVTAKMLLPEAEDLTPGTVTFQITKGRGFIIAADEILKQQSKGMIGIVPFSAKIQEVMKNSIDLEFFTSVPGLVSATNKGATAGVSGYDLGASGAPLVFNSSTCNAIYADIMDVISEAKKPEDQRFAIFPTWARSQFLQSELGKVLNSGDATSMMRTGKMGMLYGNTAIFFSNQLPVTVDGVTGKKCWNVLAGHISGITFTAQMKRVRTYESTKTFGMVSDGYIIYDYKVVNSDALAIAYITKN